MEITAQGRQKTLCNLHTAGNARSEHWGVWALLPLFFFFFDGAQAESQLLCHYKPVSCSESSLYHIALKNHLRCRTTHFSFDSKGFRRKLILKPVCFNNNKQFVRTNWVEKDLTAPSHTRILSARPHLMVLSLNAALQLLVSWLLWEKSPPQLEPRSRWASPFGLPWRQVIDLVNCSSRKTLPDHFLFTVISR